jgi:hypothetical protein
MMKFYCKKFLEMSLSKEQITKIQFLMAQYALEAVIDSSVREEAELIAMIECE